MGFDRSNPASVSRCASSVGVDALSVVVADAEFVELLVGQYVTIGLYKVVELYAGTRFFGVAVDVDDVVADFERVAGCGYAAFYIVFAAVDRSPDDVAKCGAIGLQVVAPEVVTERVVVGVLHFLADGVAGGKVEYDDVAFFDRVPAFQPSIFPLWFFDVGFAAAEPFGKSVLYQGE